MRREYSINLTIVYFYNSSKTTRGFCLINLNFSISLFPQWNLQSINYLTKKRVNDQKKERKIKVKF